MNKKYAKIRSACMSLIWLVVFAVSLVKLLGVNIPDMVFKAIGMLVLVLVPTLLYATKKMYKK